MGSRTAQTSRGIIVGCFLGVLGCLVQAQAPLEPAPVIVNGRTLFTVQSNLGPFTPQERAAAIAARLARLSENLSASLESIAAVRGDTSTDIVLGDQILLTVTDADAKAAGKDRGELVAEYVMAVQSSVGGLRNEYSTRSLLIGFLYTVLLTAALIVFLKLLRRIRVRAVARLERVSFHPIRLQRVELISAHQIRQSMIQAVRGLRLLLFLTALYFYIPSVMSFFPWTRAYAPRLVEYIVGPIGSAAQAVVGYLPSLFVVIICVVGGYLSIRVSHFLFRELGDGTISWPGFYPEWAEPTHKLVRFLILAITLVVMFPYLPGSESPAFRGISIFLGVLFSLGSTSAIANVIAGVILTYTRAFQVGDRVKIAETTGDVMERTLLATRIRTIKNEFITVPNAMVLGSHIINFSSSDTGVALILHTSVTIGYDAPWRTVHGLLIDAARRTSLVLKEPAPFVLQTSLDDFYVTYEINAYTAEPSRMAVAYAELHQNIQDCFNEGGVEIMSPHYASLRDGNLTTMPAEYLPKSYSAPPFRVQQERSEHGSQHADEGTPREPAR